MRLRYKWIPVFILDDDGEYYVVKFEKCLHYLWDKTWILVKEDAFPDEKEQQELIKKYKPKKK